MIARQSVQIVFGAVLLGSVVAASSYALCGNHESTLTFNRAVSLPGVVLPAGQYSFALNDSPSPSNVVVVSSRDRSKVFYVGFTSTVHRPAGMSKTAAVTFGEASADQAVPITAWYENGDSIGHAFRY